MLENFHFNKIEYLYLLFPLIMGFYFIAKINYFNKYLNLNKYKYLASLDNLEFLLKNNKSSHKKAKNILIPTMLCLIILALAQPRWKFQEIAAEKNYNNLIILLDSSNSMSAKDIVPSRFINAKDNIKNLINNLVNPRISLITFTEIPYLIAPLTDDRESLIKILENIELNNFNIQGSNINVALEAALRQYRKLNLTNKNILIISDGDFTSNIEKKIINEIVKEKINIFIQPIASKYGAPIYDKEGKKIRINGEEIIAKLNLTQIEKLANKTNGTIILSMKENNNKIYENYFNMSQKEELNFTHKIWEEAFSIFLIPAMLIFAYMLRKIISIMIILSIFSGEAKAFTLYNNNQRAEQEYKKNNYDKAANLYQDKYNKANAYYRNKNYQKAKEILETIDKRSLNAEFNLGNSNFMLKNYNEAIKNYEEILKQNPNHKKAKYNLETARKKQEEQSKENQKQEEEKDKTRQKEEQKNKTKKQENNNSKENNNKNIINMIETSTQEIQKIKIKNIEKKQGNNFINNKPW